MTMPILDVMNPATADTIGADLATSSTALALRLADYAIATVPDLEHAVKDRQVLADQRRVITDYFQPIKSMAYKLHRKICDRENQILEPLDQRDRAISRAMAVFKADQDRERAERERAAEDVAKREQQTAAVHEAAALEAAGESDLAAAVVETAITAPPPVVALPDVTHGIAKFRKVWKWRFTGGPATVTDTPIAVIARTMKLIPREFLTVDTVKVGAYVRSMKSSGSIPGIEIYSVDEPVR